MTNKDETIKRKEIRKVKESYLHIEEKEVKQESQNKKEK